MPDELEGPEELVARPLPPVPLALAPEVASSTTTSPPQAANTRAAPAADIQPRSNLARSICRLEGDCVFGQRDGFRTRRSMPIRPALLLVVRWCGAGRWSSPHSSSLTGAPGSGSFAIA